MIRDKGHAILEGVRGQQPCDTDALADALVPCPNSRGHARI